MESGREKEDAEKSDAAAVETADAAADDDEAFLTASSGESDDDDEMLELNENDLANFRDMMQADFVTDRDRLFLDRVSNPPSTDAFPDVFAAPRRLAHDDSGDDDGDDRNNHHGKQAEAAELNQNNNSDISDNRTNYYRDRDKTSICSVSEKDCDTEKETKNATAPAKPLIASASTASDPTSQSVKDETGCDTNQDEPERTALDAGGASWNEFASRDDRGRRFPESHVREADDLFHNGEEDAGDAEGASAEAAPDASKNVVNDESFIDEKAMEEAEKSMTVEEKEGHRQTAKQHKAKGNDAFKKNEWLTAFDEYNAGLRTCPLMYGDDRSVLYANRAAVRLKFDSKEERENAVLDCGKALDLNPKYLKARLRRAQTYEQLDKLENALEDYQKALEQDPGNREAFEACRRLPDVIKERNEKLKEEMMGKLKDLGNLVLKPFGLSTNNFQLQQDPNSGGYTINFKQ